jgi:hypothetical protein
METALGLVAGKGGEDVLDFMGYAVGRGVDEECRPGLNPLVRGWLYALNPAFMKTKFSADVGYDAWIAEQKKSLGDNISITPMPACEQAGVNAYLETVESARQLAEDKTAEAAEASAARKAAEAEAAAMAPFKKKAGELEKKVTALEEKNRGLNAEIAELKEKLASFEGKIALDEKEIEKSVKEIVSRAVKDAVGGLAAAGGAALGTAGPAAADEAPAEGAGAADSGGAPDDFGFGASSSSDGFGF